MRWSAVLRRLAGAMPSARGFAAAWWMAAAAALPGSESYVPVIGDMIEERWSWNRIEGLPIAHTELVHVTESGRIWLGAWKKLFVYDGMELVGYGEDSGLSAKSSIQLVKESGSGEVYAVSGRQIHVLDGERWREIGKVDGGLLSTRAVEDQEGAIWFASQKRFYRVRGTEVTASKAMGERLADMAVDSQGYLWAVDLNGTVLRCARVNGEVFVERAWENLFGERLRRIKWQAQIEETSDGSIWVINSSEKTGPLYLEKGSSDWKEVDLEALGGSNRNYSIVEPRPGEILITGEETLAKRVRGVWSLYDKEEISLSAQVSQLISAKDGYLWFWKRNESLSRIDYKGSRWRNYKDLNFETDFNGAMRLFLEKSGDAVIQDVAAGEWTAYDERDGVISDPVVGVCSPDGTFWLAGSHDGAAAVSRFEGAAWTRILLPELGSNVSHQSALVAADGSVLFGSGHLEEDRSRSRAAAVRFFYNGAQYEKENLYIGFGRIAGLAESKSMGVVGSRRGFYKLGEGRGAIPMPMPRSLRVNWIDNFFIDGDGVWFANWGEGVGYFDADTWRRYTVSDQLPSNYVSNILRLANGHILALTVEGLCRYDGASWRPVRVKGWNGVREGTTLRESTDGSIWINQASRSWNFRADSSVTTHGRFETLNYHPDRTPPETYLRLEVEEAEHSRSVYLRLKAKDPWAETPRHQIEYSYRMNGGEWSPFSIKDTVYLTGLNLGDHVVEARARDSDGNIDQSPARRSLAIVAPFWQTTWFLYLSFFAGAAVIVLVVALFAQRMRHVVELDRMRARFLTNISHEFRSPLALIMWPLEKLSKEVGSGKSMKHVTMALRNAKRLNQLVEQVLDYRRAEVGGIQLSRKVGDVVSFAKVIVADFENLASSRGQTVRFYCDEAAYKTQFDDDLLRKILDNLILNALKFSSDGAQVTLSMRFGVVDGFGEDRVRMVVEDEGMGIRKDAVKNIFEPFYRGEKDKGAQMRSFGVGLALVKELVDFWQGSISVESPIHSRDGQRFGSRFTVELPFFEKLVDIKNPMQSDIVLSEEAAAEGLVPFPAIDGADESKRAMILIVDDHVELREYIADELSDRYEVIEAENGVSGLAMAKRHVPDIILSDVLMPEMDGIAFCDEIRTHPATSHIPLILQTSLATEEGEAAGLESGAVDYVLKPVSIDILTKRIESHLENRRRYADFLKAKILSPVASSEGAKPNPELRFLGLVRDVIAKNWDRYEFNSETLALEMGMSRSSFYRKFTAITNLPPSEAIKSYRLEKAAELLAEGQLVSEVAERICYSEASPFYRAFKKRFGCSPAEYRKRRGA